MPTNEATTLIGTFTGTVDYSVTLNITQQQSAKSHAVNQKPLALSGELITSSILEHSHIMMIKVDGFYWPYQEHRPRRLFTLTGKTWIPNTKTGNPPDLFILQTISGYSEAKNKYQLADTFTAHIATVSDTANTEQPPGKYTLESGAITLYRA